MLGQSCAPTSDGMHANALSSAATVKIWLDKKVKITVETSPNFASARVEIDNDNVHLGIKFSFNRHCLD